MPYDLSIRPPEGPPSEIGVWIWALRDQRSRTLRFVDRLPGVELERTAPGAPNSIGTLLYHLAATEMSWLFEDVREEEDLPGDVKTLLPYPYRNEEGKLHPVTGESLSAHLERLDATREVLFGHFASMGIEEFHRPRRLDDREVTPEWILYHLLEHEAHHAGQIRMLRGQLAG